MSHTVTLVTLFSYPDVTNHVQKVNLLRLLFKVSRLLESF